MIKQKRFAFSRNVEIGDYTYMQENKIGDVLIVLETYAFDIMGGMLLYVSWYEFGYPFSSVIC